MKTLDNKKLEALLRTVRAAVEDTICELSQAEVIELTSMALDRKLDAAKKQLDEVLDDE